MYRVNGMSNQESACQLQNDLSLSTHSDQLFIYADNHQVHTNCTTPVNATLKLKSEVEEMYQWYNANLLNANRNKYHVLAIKPKWTTNDKNRRVTFELASCVGESLKILGVTIDNKLTFSKHISDICKKTSQNISVLTRVRASSMST